MVQAVAIRSLIAPKILQSTNFHQKQWYSRTAPVYERARTGGAKEESRQHVMFPISYWFTTNVPHVSIARADRVVDQRLKRSMIIILSCSGSGTGSAVCRLFNPVASSGSKAITAKSILSYNIHHFSPLLLWTEHHFNYLESLWSRLQPQRIEQRNGERKIFGGLVPAGEDMSFRPQKRGTNR